MSQTARVLSGLVAGILIGMLLAWQAPDLGLRIAAIVEPFGKLWLNALQMTVVPLVFALVVVGINQASDAAHSGRVARRAILIFVALLTAAAALAALLAAVRLAWPRVGAHAAVIWRVLARVHSEELRSRCWGMLADAGG